MKITREFIESGATNGVVGWSKKQFALLGLPPNPKSGWKDQIIGNEISYEDAQLFLQLKGTSKNASRAIAVDTRYAELEGEVEHWKGRYYEVLRELEDSR